MTDTAPSAPGRPSRMDTQNAIQEQADEHRQVNQEAVEQTGPEAPAASMDDWNALNVRIGTVRAARRNDRARIPALVLDIDFGPHGRRTTSAQLTARHTPESILGRQVVCVLGLPPKRVAGVVSTCLVLAAVPDGPDALPGDAVVLVPDAPIPDGTPVA